MAFDIQLGRYRTCDGMSRRSLLKIGALGLGGLSLPALLRNQATADENAAKTGAPKTAAKAKNVILLWQGGGPSHLDMWDLKPDAPSEFRGTFNPIKSNVPGYDVGEHMPYSAKICDKLSIIRSTTHRDGGHESASHFLLTGYAPTNDIPSNEMPSYGSVVSKELGPSKPGMPGYVAVPQASRSSAAAYLGLQYNPFEVHGDPNNDQFSVRNLKLPGGLNLDRLEFRRKMLSRFDTLRRDADASGQLSGMDSFYQQAFEMVTSPQVQKAFNLGDEPMKLREEYGRQTWGQSMLLARRLVQSGVRFVQVNVGGWDTHGNNFESLKTGLLPKFDRPFAALIEDLKQQGMLDETLVLVWGEFGRTPRINSGAGRDHWPNVFTTVLAGGGTKPGVLGKSDSRAEEPLERPVSPQDVLATMYHLLGVERHKTYTNEASRPVEILNYGQPVKEIL